jgi:hypothetical protein
MVVLGDVGPESRHGLTRAASMPTLFRFILVLGILGGVGYGAMFALATFVQPQPREITVTIPQDKFYKNR